jgi:hypothetical protein
MKINNIIDRLKKSAVMDVYNNADDFIEDVNEIEMYIFQLQKKTFIDRTEIELYGEQELEAEKGGEK